MSTLFERNESSMVDYVEFTNTSWQAQTFTIGATGQDITHKLTSLTLLLHKDGSPGTITVSIRATDGEGKPTGADLSTGTTDGNTLIYEPSWREISMSPYTLQAGTKYAIVIRASAPMGCFVVSGDEYAGGFIYSSNNSGSTWYVINYTDGIFREYGDLIGGAITPNTKYWGS